MPRFRNAAIGAKIGRRRREWVFQRPPSRYVGRVAPYRRAESARARSCEQLLQVNRLLGRRDGRPRHAFALSVAAISVAWLGACNTPRAEPAPYRCTDCNVLLISMDTLRADHVGAYGYTARPTTPNVDRLAARGVVFENAIAQSSWTRPAHMSIFTGLYPREHGFVALSDRARLAANVPTLAGVLSEHGYTTAAFAGGINMSPVFGFDNGFDLYRVNGHSFRDNLEEAKYWLDGHSNQRFFLFFHGYDAHTPYRSDPIDRIELGLDQPPPGKRFRKICKSLRVHRLEQFVAEYDGGIHKGDRYVGKLLDYMRSLGLLDHTLVVFLSDHGEEFLEHGRCFHLTTLYREVLHVALVFAGPGLEPRRVGGLVPGSVSIAATILEAVGIDGHPIPGPSLAGVLGGAAPDFDYVQSETFRREDGGQGEGHVMALTGETDKLIRWESRDEVAYFHLRSDPGEQAPIREGPDVERLERRLAAWKDTHEKSVTSKALTEEQSRSLHRKLRALGYVD
jgi:arylsulfatase A-like enzyme